MLVPAVKSLNQKLLLHYAHFFFFFHLPMYTPTPIYLPNACVTITKYTHSHTHIQTQNIRIFRHKTKPDIAIVSKKTIQTMEL